jgi:hypothetical protein
MLMLDPSVAWSQPGAPAALDLEVFQEPLEEWDQIAYSGTLETARYALYQLRQRPLLALYWRPLAASELSFDRAWALDFMAETVDPEYRLSLDTSDLREWTHLDHPAWMYAGPDQSESGIDRVIVWPCLTSGRLFAVELTIDRTLETDPEWLSVLQSVASSIACHGPVRQVEQPAVALDRVVLRDDLRLGFRVPSDWESGLLDHGSTPQQGILWVATTRSTGMVLLRRRDDRSGPLRELLQTTVELLPVALARENRTVQVIQEGEQHLGNEWAARGVFRVQDPEWGWISGEHRFMILVFGARGEQHAILVSWLATPDVKGMPLGLTTPWNLVERLMERASSAYYP